MKASHNPCCRSCCADVAALPRIVLTSGEPAGVGPDLLLAIADRPFPCELVVSGHPELLRARACLLGAGVAVEPWERHAVGGQHRPGRLLVLPTDRLATTEAGKLDPDNAAYVLETIGAATRACLHGVFDALVTPPVHKGIINQAGFAFTGHTEFIAEITGGDPVMMLAIPGMRVALATTHLPLTEVSGRITVERLTRVLRTLHADLHARFALPNPRILVCGLNPHAGEGGHLGREEIDVIAPVIASLQTEGMALTGPLPADTAFLPKYLEQADAVLAMYHDQGLPVLKYAGFGRAVNVTLGLPIIRTSVDHGTATDLAGSGRADPGSLIAAIELAIEMVQRSRLQ
jgi:4-hydroxythreonine-4-phosphate dehydrogenase